MTQGRSQRALIAASVVSLLASAVAGCGSSSDGTTTTSTSVRTVTPRAKESADPLPKLDRGWSVVRSRSGGFALGRPPGWKPERKGLTLTLLAPDRLVAVTVSANRSPSGLAIAPGRFADRTARSLAGYKGKLEPSKPRPFKHRYKAQQVVERARSSDGVRQELRMIAVRRTALVTFAGVIARNADRPDAQEVKHALAIVRSIRSRPAGKGPTDRSPSKRN